MKTKLNQKSESKPGSLRRQRKPPPAIWLLPGAPKLLRICSCGDLAIAEFRCAACLAHGSNPAAPQAGSPPSACATAGAEEEGWRADKQALENEELRLRKEALPLNCWALTLLEDFGFIPFLATVRQHLPQDLVLVQKSSRWPKGGWFLCNPHQLRTASKEELVRKLRPLVDKLHKVEPEKRQQQKDELVRYETPGKHLYGLELSVAPKPKTVVVTLVASATTGWALFQEWNNPERRYLVRGYAVRVLQKNFRRSPPGQKPGDPEQLLLWLPTDSGKKELYRVTEFGEVDDLLKLEAVHHPGKTRTALVSEALPQIRLFLARRARARRSPKKRSKRPRKSLLPQLRLKRRPRGKPIPKTARRRRRKARLAGAAAKVKEKEKAQEKAKENRREPKPQGAGTETAGP
jgi:hypothetical protein